MKATKYTVKFTAQFKRDYKLAMKRGLDVKLLEGVIASLAMGEQLPDKTGITPWAVDGLAIGSVTSCRTGC